MDNNINLVGFDLNDGDDLQTLYDNLGILFDYMRDGIQGLCTLELTHHTRNEYYSEYVKQVVRLAHYVDGLRCVIYAKMVNDPSFRQDTILQKDPSKLSVINMDDQFMLGVAIPTVGVEIEHLIPYFQEYCYRNSDEINDLKYSMQCKHAKKDLAVLRGLLTTDADYISYEAMQPLSNLVYKAYANIKCISIARDVDDLFEWVDTAQIRDFYLVEDEKVEFSGKKENLEPYQIQEFRNNTKELQRLNGVLETLYDDLNVVIKGDIKNELTRLHNIYGKHM